MTHSFKPEVVEKVARAIIDAMGQTSFTDEEWANAHPKDKETALSWATAALSIPEIAALYEALEDAREQLWHLAKDGDKNYLIAKIDKVLTLCRKGTK